MKLLCKFSVLLMILSACQREKVDVLGPAYISAPEGFTVTTFAASHQAVDFSLDSVKFNAVFTNTVSWTLIVVGQQSGAVYETKGISNGLSDAVWKGTHSSVCFFRKGENAIATLSFYGTAYTSSITITVAKTRDFSTYGQFPITGDFETPSKIEPKIGPPAVYSPYWAAFNFPNPIPNVAQGVDSMAIDYNGNPIPPVEGTRYYYIKGKGNQQVFVSGMQYYGALVPTLPATPDNIWVNIYLWGTGDANTGVEIEYQEDDKYTGPGYDGKKDDAFTAKLTLDHKGWKLFSFKYSDLAPSLNADFGGSGNKIHEPNRLKSFDLVVVKKNNPDSPIEVYFDYPIITVGGPFNPSK